MQGLWSTRPGGWDGLLAGPEGRLAALRRFLDTANAGLAAAGSVVLWPRFDGAARWRAEYVGEEPERVRRWLSPRLDSSLEEILAELPGGAPRISGASPHPVTLGVAGGLWVLWRTESVHAERLGRLRQELGTFVEVERGEQIYFGGGSPLGEEATQALRRGDEGPLPELLSLTRTVSGADLVYLGSVHDGVVDVEWNLGAEGSGFGFELPVGEGIGGRVSARDATIEIPDYLNCQYRYPEVSDITDGERARSILAVPVHGEGSSPGAVLYAVRREVSRFSHAQRSLLQRISRSIEPVPGAWPSSRHFFPAHRNGAEDLRSGLRRILGRSNKIQELETWLERAVGGPAILADRQDHPYLLRDAERFDRLTGPDNGGEPRVVPLDAPAHGEGTGGGSLYLWPSSELRFEGWPDFVEDVAVACNVVIDRAEQGYYRLNQRRSRWVRDVMEGRDDPRLLREGNRLGLPVDGGEVWAIAWSPGHGSGGTRKEMLAEDIGLDQLGSPLISLDRNVGVFLLKDEPGARPSAVRDELLKAFGPDPLWLVHDAGYESLEGLRESLCQAVGIAERARSNGEEHHVAGVKGWGLDSLLEHPRISEELAAFGESLLAPLVSYDRERGSRLTETFCLSLTLDSLSEVARRLYVHENTVRYRVRRAGQLLGRDLGSSRERVTLGLAAFVWLRHG